MAAIVSYCWIMLAVTFSLPLIPAIVLVASLFILLVASLSLLFAALLSVFAVLCVRARS